MGRNWIGFQPVSKPIDGDRIVVQETFVPVLPVSDLLQFLTTADGLSAWLAPVLRFSSRRGGDIDFADGSGAFTGTFSLLEIPNRITLITDRHGEIDARIRAGSNPVTCTVAVTCVAPRGDESDAARLRSETLLQQLKACIA